MNFNSLQKYRTLGVILIFLLIFGCSQNKNDKSTETLQNESQGNSLTTPSTDIPPLKKISDYYTGFQPLEVNFEIQFDQGHLNGILNLYQNEKNISRVFEYMQWAGVKVYTDNIEVARQNNIYDLSENPEIEKIWSISQQSIEETSGISLDAGQLSFNKNIYHIQEPSIVLNSDHLTMENILHEFLHFLISQFNIQNSNEIRSNLEEARITLLSETEKFLKNSDNDFNELKLAMMDFDESKRLLSLRNLFHYLKPGDHTLPFKEKLQAIFHRILQLNNNQLSRIYEFSKNSFLEEAQIEKICMNSLAPLGIQVQQEYFISEISKFFSLTKDLLESQENLITLMKSATLNNNETERLITEYLNEYKSINSEVEILLSN